MKDLNVPSRLFDSGFGAVVSVMFSVLEVYWAAQIYSFHLIWKIFDQSFFIYFSDHVSPLRFPKYTCIRLLQFVP